MSYALGPAWTPGCCDGNQWKEEGILPLEEKTLYLKTGDYDYSQGWQGVESSARKKKVEVENDDASADRPEDAAILVSAA